MVSNPIYVDFHERKTKKFNIEIPRILERYEVPITKKRLDVGDYVIIGERSVCIESKTAEDYLSSIEIGIINDELLQISANYDYGILMVHGNINDALFHRKIQRRTWYEYIAGCVVNVAPTGKQGKISVVTVETVHDAVFFIRTIWKKITTNNYIREPTAQKVGIPKGLEQIYTLKWLFPPECHIGQKRAKILLRKFKSIKGVINATKDDIEAIDGFGDKIASSMMEHLERRFK